MKVKSFDGGTFWYFVQAIIKVDFFLSEKSRLSGIRVKEQSDLSDGEVIRTIANASL